MFIVAIIIIGIGIAGVILLPQTLYAGFIDEIGTKTGVCRERMFSGIRAFIVKASISLSYVQWQLFFRYLDFNQEPQHKHNQPFWEFGCSSALFRQLFYLLKF